MLIRILSMAALFALVINANALDADARLSLGYDDNPFKLADDLDHHSGWFVNTKLKAKQDIENFRFRASVHNRSYESSLDDADTTLVKVDGRYKKKYKIGDKKVISHVSVKYDDKNKTYVKRSTGEVATFSGQKIDNRYDYDSVGAEAKTTMIINRGLSAGLELNYLDRNYYDYDIKGLSNLDYDKYELINDWKYKYSKSSRFKFSISAAKLEFDDRREKDLSGSSVANTDLDYDFVSAAIVHKYKFSSDLESKVEFEYIERRDSGSGYYDTDSTKLSAKLNYKINNRLDLVTQVMYQDYNYLNDIPFDENNPDSEHPDKEGYTIKVDLEKELGTIKELPAFIFAGIRYDDYDSRDPIYEYDRFQAVAGIKIIF